MIPLVSFWGMPEGDGAAKTGNNPLWMRHWRAVDRPSSCHLIPSERRRGITNVIMGTAGLYLLTSDAVWPAPPPGHPQLQPHGLLVVQAPVDVTIGHVSDVDITRECWTSRKSPRGTTSRPLTPRQSHAVVKVRPVSMRCSGAYTPVSVLPYHRENNQQKDRMQEPPPNFFSIGVI